MKKNGRIHKFGDHIDTDVIIPARYCVTLKENELAQHCMNDIRERFYQKVNKGDILVAGENFGCGSSREAAPIAIKACGIDCVIAKSFARIFFRNAINIGLMMITNDALYDSVYDGDIIEIDFENGRIAEKNNRFNIEFERCDNGVIDEIIKHNGLINYIKAHQFNI